MKAIFAKLLKVQAEIKPIARDATNPHYKSKYFDISGLLAELKPVLTKHGLVLLQPLDAGQIITIVTDVESGEQIVYAFTLPELQDPQKMGGAISYYRRYSLTSLFALESEDDDGEVAATAPKREFVFSNATKCAKCSGPMKTSAAGKPYCAAVCWKNAPAEIPVKAEPNDNPFV